MSTNIYDIVVVGRGPCGTAASKYLAEKGKSVALIGPSSLANKDSEVFSSHNDDTRIARTLESTTIWSLLARRSVSRYKEIEQKSGIKFFRERNYLAVGPMSGTFISTLESIHKTDCSNISSLSYEQLCSEFPYFRFTEGTAGLFEKTNAGILNPKDMIQAQLALAKSYGATIIDDCVVSVKDQNGIVELLTQSGDTLHARQALLAAGCFINCHNLVEKKVDVEIHPRTVVLAEVSDEWVDKLKSMPSLIYKGTAQEESYYIMPPMRYSDGKIYIKAGLLSNKNGLLLSTHQELNHWFSGIGSEDNKSSVLHILHNLIPGFEYLSVCTEACAIDSTRDGRLYVDKIAPRIGVIAGGNGQACKSSDEIGLVAATLMIADNWTYDLNASEFKIHK